MSKENDYEFLKRVITYCEDLQNFDRDINNALIDFIKKNDDFYSEDLDKVEDLNLEVQKKNKEAIKKKANLNEYEFDENDLKRGPLLGIHKCENCKQFDTKELNINKKTLQRYIYCYSCNSITEIEPKHYEELIEYSKNVPQDIELILELWEFLNMWLINNIRNYDFRKKDAKELNNEFVKAGYKMFELANEKFENLNNEFLSDIVNNSIDFCYEAIKSKKD